jgi:putative glutamine amidotransferase
MMPSTPRPLIGITTQTLQVIEGIPSSLPPSMVMNERYHLAANAAGGAAILIPLIPDDLAALRSIYDHLDGVLLPGGVDVDPSNYGIAAHAKLGRLDPARDRTEMQLAKWAVAEGKPILGVCRGVQVLNVACGGTLWQDIESEISGAMKHDCFPEFGFTREHLAHAVSITSGTRLGDAIGTDDLRVNSLHHQAIRHLGEGMTATAVAPDGVVEAIEKEGSAFVMGVQWHPEALEQDDTRARAIFQAFIGAAREKR